MGNIVDQFGRKVLPQRSLRKSYDIARTTDANRKWWAVADFLSPDAVMSPEVRKYARSRCRQECANNSICDGIVDTLCNDTVGTGPRIQVPLKDENAGGFLEREFTAWMEEIGIAGKLWLGRGGVVVDGETLLLFQTNPLLYTPVKLNVRGMETDRLTTPVPNLTDPDFVDGIEYDEYGNAIKYHILRHHPGSAVGFQPDDTDSYEARNVIFWTALTRVEQHRGWPELAPAVPLFAALRRFREATITAAETAADPAAVVASDNPTADQEGQSFDPMDTIDFEKGMMLVLPDGFKLMQMRPEHPATTYEMFVREITKEALRCVSMPYIVASGDSSDANYSSGRLDHQVYHKAIRVMQSHIERIVLRRLWFAWLDEAVLLPNYLPPGLPIFTQIPVEWYWDEFPHVDPKKEAEAAEIRLRTNVSTLKKECARDGSISTRVIEQRGREREQLRKEGLLNEQTTPNATAN